MGITFNGYDFSALGLHVVGRSLPFAPAKRSAIQDLPFRDGGVGYIGRFQTGRISLDCILQGTRADLDTVRYRLALPDTERTLIINDIPDRYWKAKWVPTGDEAQYIGTGGFMLTLNFLTPDSLAYKVGDASEATRTVDATPFNTTITAAGGTAHANPIWKITVVGGTPSSYLELENTTTEETIRRSAATGAGHIWRVDTERRIVHISTDGGTSWARAMTSLSKFQFPRLAPRIANAIVVRGTDDATLNVEWIERYV